MQKKTFSSGAIAKSRNLSLSTGICLPSPCSIKDAREIAIYVLSKASLNVTSVMCEVNSPISFRIRIVAIVIFSMLLLTVIACTIYELYMNHEESECDRCLVITTAITRVHFRNSNDDINRVLSLHQREKPFRNEEKRIVEGDWVSQRSSCSLTALDHLRSSIFRYVSSASDQHGDSDWELVGKCFLSFAHGLSLSCRYFLRHGRFAGDMELYEVFRCVSLNENWVKLKTNSKCQF